MVNLFVFSPIPKWQNNSISFVRVDENRFCSDGNSRRAQVLSEIPLEGAEP